MATFAIPLHSAASNSPPTQWSRLPAYSSPASPPSNFPVGNSSVSYAVSAQEATFRPRKRRRTAQAEFRNMRSATEDHQDEETSGGELVQLEIYSTQAPGRASKVIHPRHYDSGPNMMEALGSFFKITGNNCFLGTYHAQNTPEIPDKHRIQLVIHEIWRVTGYRFTVKDHPPAKNGHTTRLWCSQDSQRKANTRYTSNGAKQRFPCRSRLLVSSRDGKTSGYRSITVRMYHHVQHEPYSDSAIPIAASTSSAMSTFLQPNLNTPTVDNGPQSGVYYSEGLSPPRLPPLGESDDEECLSEGGGNDDEDGRGETHFATDSVSPHHPDQASSTFHQRAQFVPSYPPPMTIPLTQHPLYAAPVIYSVLSHSPLNTLGREHVVPGPGYQSHSHPHPDSHPSYAAPLLTARPPVTPSPYSSSHSHRLLPQPPIPPQAQGVEPPPMSAPNGNGNGRGSSTQSESSPSNRSHGLPSNSSSSPSSSPPLSLTRTSTNVSSTSSTIPIPGPSSSTSGLSHEKIQIHIHSLRSFCDAIEYQIRGQSELEPQNHHGHFPGDSRYEGRMVEEARILAELEERGGTFLEYVRGWERTQLLNLRGVSRSESESELGLRRKEMEVDPGYGNGNGEDGYRTRDRGRGSGRNLGRDSTLSDVEI